MYLIKTLGRAHITLSMVKQEVRSGMSVKVFVPKVKCADKLWAQDLVSLALPERRATEKKMWP
jgi:hypothetical protein